MVSNKSTDSVVNASQVSKNQEDIMDILSTEIKHLKAEVKLLDKQSSKRDASSNSTHLQS